MKSKSILFTLFVAATAFAIFNNCSGNRKEDATEAHSHEAGEASMSASDDPTGEAADPQFAVDAKFQQELADVFDAYVSLKDAFVSSDEEAIKAEAVTTGEALAKTDMKLLSGAAHRDWMTYLPAMNMSLKKMEEATDIEVRREAFSSLTDNLYKSIKAYGLGGATAYYDFCPMAFDSQGGFWLSTDKEIRNPYFGEKMLTCGEVRETLH